MNSVSAIHGFSILTAAPFDPLTQPLGAGYARVPVVAWDIFSSADPRPIAVCRPHPLAQPALQFPDGRVSCGGRLFPSADVWFHDHIEREREDAMRRANKAGVA